MKNFAYLLIVVTLLFSCKPETGYRESSFFDWRPRKVNNVFISLGYRTYYTWSGSNYTDYHGLDFDGDGGMVNSSFFLAILTSNHNPVLIWKQKYPGENVRTRMPIFYLDIDGHISEYLDERNTNIEKQIQNNYDRYIGGGAYVKGYAYDRMIEGEYRLTEITDLKIFTLNTRLFGKNAGEPLNDLLKIVKYNLPAIFTAPTEKLVYGYEPDNRAPVTIDEWLNLQPLAQETMWLVPTISIPEKLPLEDVQFVVEMTTKEGKVLRDTTQMITITE